MYPKSAVLSSVTLPLTLSKNGFEYIQLLRTAKLALYRQKCSQGIYCYEVFIIKSRPERCIKGKLLPAGEVFPSNENFGRTAWVFRSPVKAIQRLVSLIK